MTTLSVTNAGLSYGSRPALTDVSLDIPSGSLVAIWGHLAAGKPAS